MKEVRSYNEFIKSSKNKEKVYVLLYKKGSESSDCSFKNITTASKNIKDLELFTANVNATKDIHPKFNITTVPTLLEIENGNLKNIIKGCNDTKYYTTLFENAVYFTSAKNSDTPQKKVTVYSTPTCTWCNTLKTYLRKNRIRFTDIDVSKDQRMADELVKRSGQMGVPQTDIDGEIIVGFNQARINQLLGIK